MFPLTNNHHISFGYGEHSYAYKDRRHKGVDFKAKIGTPVHAAVSGVVVHAGRNGLGVRRGWGRAYGTQVIVRCDPLPGTGRTGYAGYMHLSKVKVKRGQRVHFQTLLGYTGNSGNSTGPHLHFEVQKARFWGGWKGSINPLPWLAAQP